MCQVVVGRPLILLRERNPKKYIKVKVLMGCKNDLSRVLVVVFLLLRCCRYISCRKDGC